LAWAEKTTFFELKFLGGKMIKKITIFYFIIFGFVQVLFSQALVVIDLSQSNQNGNVIPKIYFTQKCELKRDFFKLIPTPTPPKTKIDNWENIKQCIGKFSEMEVAECGRWISKRNQEINIYVFHFSNFEIDSVKVTEDKRESKISEDFKNLVKLIPFAPSVSAQEAPGILMFVKQYYLEKSKGKIKISVAYSKASASENKLSAERPLPTPGPTPAPKNGDKKESDEGLYVEFITGNTEHFSLSADVPLFSIKDAEFTNSKDEVIGIFPADTPKTVFIGLNFQLSDILNNAFIKSPYLKFMFQFSKSPFDVFGIGLGWNLIRIKLLEKLGIKTNAICIFGGIFWAKESEESTNQGRKSRYQLRWGLSYDLTKISEWFKK
jgi:hypothetical protein